MSANYHSSQEASPPPAYDSIFDARMRQAFVRNVYSILVLQLLVTIFIIALFTLVRPIKNWVRHSPRMLLCNFIGSLIVLLVLLFHRKSYPLNMYLLGLYTVMESYVIGTIVSRFNTTIVLQALLITLGIFINLAIFAIQTKFDFSGIGVYLCASLWILILACLIQIIVPFRRWLHLGIAITSAILFSTYIIYDTQQAVRHLAYDEYITAAVDLYLDFINLFLNIIDILRDLSND
ncbi:inhibitor of apoptosis-promoting Bax1-domain-containing protein [Syncephalis plumigaleata]|nr:inhibitor of apoptosis-promoting Bax1-domain-containing protein [Syncephalis plumigaleata]